VRVCACVRAKSVCVCACIRAKSVCVRACVCVCGVSGIGLLMQQDLDPDSPDGGDQNKVFLTK